VGGGVDVGGGATRHTRTCLGSYQWLTVAPGGGGGAAAAATVRMPLPSLASQGRKRAYILSLGETPLEMRMHRLSPCLTNSRSPPSVGQCCAQHLQMSVCVYPCGLDF
jgi:hypothetical protein